MNEYIKKLYSIAQKESRLIIGLMSGTSLDGLDIAACNISGHGAATRVQMKKFVTIPYNTTFKKEIREIFSQPMISQAKLCLLNKYIATTHAAMINDCLKKWKIKKEAVDLIASHGQTVYHLPASAQPNNKYGSATLQIGDGDHIALHTGIITISDFRQKHIAAGGDGAPLAVYGDHILFAEKNRNVIMLNIGGIANFSFLPAGLERNDIFSTDTGPGNTLMDAWMQQNFPGKYYDKDAAIAKQGTPDKVLLAALLRHKFFSLPQPKTTGPELFNMAYLENAMASAKGKELSRETVMATLNSFTAISISDAINRRISKNSNCMIYTSGGGIHNPLLMETLKKNITGASFHSTMEKHIDPDAKEAILFALLANETVAGTGNSFGKMKTKAPKVNMGKISMPG